MMKVLPTLLFVSFLVACSDGRTPSAGPEADKTATFEYAVEPADVGRVPNLTRFGPLYFSGQPSESDWPALKQAGIDVVVNLRDEMEHPGYDQDAVLRKQGFSKVVHVELRAGGWASADLNRVFSEMDNAIDSNRPTLVHCASSNRSGAVFWAWLVHRGYAIEQARELAKQAGMSSEERAARGYIEHMLR